MPLSRLDLPRIAEAIRELHRTIEYPPAESWQAPTWLVEQYKQTTLEEVEVPNKPPHAWLINTAVVEVLNRLMPPWHHKGADCPEITESRLDMRHKVALVNLRNLLNRFALGENLAHNRSEALQVLAFLESVLCDLVDGPDQGTGATRDQAETGQDREVRQKGKRGAPTSSDPKADKRVCVDWKAAKGQGMTRKAFARERGITVQDLIDAQHREKYRRRRDAE
jgi:hypothetical protein